MPKKVLKHAGSARVDRYKVENKTTFGDVVGKVFAAGFAIVVLVVAMRACSGAG